MAKKKLSRKKINPNKHVFTGEKYSDNIKMQLISYTVDDIKELKQFSEKELTGFRDDGRFYWLNIHGLHDVEQIQAICNKLKIHNLALQDILDVNQRPKSQDYENYWFFSTKSAQINKNEEIEYEQMSFILGKNYLVSFQEKVGDHFEHVRERLRGKIGVLREKGTDYLLFLLFEALLDNYFKTLDHFENKLETIGSIELDSDPSPDVLNKIENYNRQIYLIKKTIVPTKESIIKVEREEQLMFSPSITKYYAELKDLCSSLIDECDKMSSRLDSTTNLFFSVQGHRMNQVMKTLTIVATIFIPLTFIVGVYGMNFTNMPELGLKWGYFSIWGIMLIVLAIMVVYFRRKKWF